MQPTESPKTTVVPLTRLPVGTEVCVRNRFEGGWSRGFVVDDVVSHGYRLRRLSDGVVLPSVFGPASVRWADAPPA